MRSSAGSDPRSAARRDRGQASVELALATPVLCLLLLGIVQVAVVVRDQIAVIEAARVAARAASVAVDPAAAAGAAVGLRGANVRTAAGGDTVHVVVTLTNGTDIPLIGTLLPDVTVEASATMVLEPP